MSVSVKVVNEETSVNVVAIQSGSNTYIGPLNDAIFDITGNNTYVTVAGLTASNSKVKVVNGSNGSDCIIHQSGANTVELSYLNYAYFYVTDHSSSYITIEN